MNIFVSDENPVESAKNLDDKRVIKMILESAQMLSTALHHWHSESKSLVYKPTHANHPCNVWVRTNSANYLWLYHHFMALCDEYRLRYGREHASMPYGEIFHKASADLPYGSLTPFANCAAHKELGLDFKAGTNVPAAYRLYLTARWDTDKRKPTWFGKEERPF